MGLLAKIVQTAKGESDFERVTKRIQRIRASGSASNGVHTLFGKVKISEDDYLIMGCDCTCARRNHPGITDDELMQGLWFTGGSDLDGSRFGNCHGTMKGNRMVVDSFYSSIPYAKYAATPQEVAWQYVRVRQLRAQKMPNDQRIITMTAEAKQRPWEQMN